MKYLWVLLLVMAACGETKATPAASTATIDATADGAADTGQDAAQTADDAAATQDSADTAQTSTLCEDGDVLRPWQTAPEGTYHRGELAGDFTLDLLDGTTFHLADAWNGCDNYVFLVDSIPVSDTDLTSIWTKTKDIESLLKKSPLNVHYFFVSRSVADAKAAESLQAMQDRLAEAVQNLSAEQNEHWWPRLHVVAQRAGKIPGWVGKALQTHGKLGMGVDRQQRIRGFGLLADVTRYKSALQAAQKWPWEANLAYAQYEVQWWNQLSLQHKRRSDDAQAAKHAEVALWTGQVISQFAEVTATLDSVGDISQYDTLEVDVDMACPDAEGPEPGNCGAWDYIASLSVYPKAGAADPNARIEMARFITSYHRETHWTVDATPLLAELAGGGQRRIRWEWAPEWNVQPTATTLTLRFSNRGKGLRPVSTQLLWKGGGFNSKYDTLHPDRSVTIPAGAKKVELWTLITGHGSAQGTQCAEFCNHHHKFSIGSQTWVKDHPAAQNQQGCIAEVKNGMTPNQGGTWWFGRGGWCPGEQVEPWIADITASAPAGSTQNISYHGQYQNATPPDGDANIDGTVYLVVYQ